VHFVGPSVVTCEIVNIQDDCRSYIVMVALGFISADGGCVSCMMELLNQKYYFFSDNALLHYVGVPTLRSTVTGILKISVSCINIPFMELRFESGMQFPTTD
jgi:hypothetical protein